MLNSCNCYRPQTKFAKVVFSQVSVCPQVVGVGGVCPIACWGTHASPPGPEVDTPWADTTWADIPPVHAGIHPPTQCMLGYGQQACGTHPTGMHSCSVNFSSLPHNTHKRVCRRPNN